MTGRWWAALRQWQERRTLTQRAIPEALWALTLARFPFLNRLPPSDAATLRRLSTLFLARKQFHGVGRFTVTDDVAVAIAAQACLPILHLGLDWYDGFVGIVVHESEVVAQRTWLDEDGVLHHWDEPLLGEATAGGPVTLCWQGVTEVSGTSDWAFNVVIHEFAHVLDMRDGEPNGMPPMPNRDLHTRWQREFAQHFNQFCAQVDAEQDTQLDPYGAESPDEFFAVVCETFFTAPETLWRHHTSLYELLREYFQQDPRRWPPSSGNDGPQPLR